MALSTKNAKDIGTPWVHFFLYGDTGSGKTKAASTFPRPLFLVPQNENSITTLRGQDVPYYEIIDMSSPVADGIGGMIAVLDEIERAYDKGPEEFPFDTIVIESISHYADLCIEEMSKGNALQMDQQKWGRLGSHFRNLQTRLRKLDCHVVFTALAKASVIADAEDGGGQAPGAPLIQGQTALKLPSACDVIGYCEEYRANAKDLEYRVHFRKYRHFPARSRFSRMPAVVKNFDFKKVEAFLKPDV